MNLDKETMMVVLDRIEQIRNSMTEIASRNDGRESDFAFGGQTVCERIIRELKELL